MKQKVLRTLFHGCDEYENGIKQNSGSFYDLFRECDNDPNDTMNLFSYFCKLEKDKQCLFVLWPSFPVEKMIRILFVLDDITEKLNSIPEVLTH